MIHHDKDDQSAQRESFITRFGLTILAALCLLAPMAAGAFTAYPSNDGQHRTDASITQRDANSAHGAKPHEGSLQQGIPPKPSESPNDTPYYNEPTPATQLTTLYTDALREAVQDKDTKACQAGLNTYRTELASATPKVRAELDKLQVPSEYEAFYPKRDAWVCKTAQKLTLMNGLTPKAEDLERLNHTLDVATGYSSKGERKTCYDIMTVDYRAWFDMATPGSQIYISYTSLALPEELTDKHLARICGYNDYQKTV